MSRAFYHSFFDFYDTVPLGFFSATAGGAGAGTVADPEAHTTAFFDRIDSTSGSLCLMVQATLGDGQSAVISGVSVSEAAATDGLGATPLVTAPNLTLTGGAGGSTEEAIIEIPVSFASASVAVGGQFSVGMTAANTDQVVIAPFFVAGRRSVG